MLDKQNTVDLPVVIEQGNLPAPAMVTPDAIAEMVTALDDVVKSVMVKDSDYGIIPGTKKPTLYKAGAEKLNAVFGFAAHFELLDKVEDHFKDWEFKKRDKAEQTRGFFYYRYRCILTTRSGQFAGDAEGSFSSMERGRETAPANTIQKMAQKRALVAVTLLATFSSDRFTQDLEDAPRDSGGDQSSPSSDLPGVEFEMTSTKDNGFCWYCKKKHINSGDAIVKAKIPEKPDAVWGAKDCYKKNILKPEAPPAGPDKSTSEDDTKNALTDKILNLESVKFGDSNDVKIAGEIETARKQNMGTADLNQASEIGLENYLEYLNKE